jgi:8-hydroxy-5-deazaflavin:NADPH oxidoreductase
MSYRIAILGGTGPEGTGLARRWAEAGNRILLGSRQAQRARDAAKALSARAASAREIEGCENAAALAGADVAVLTVPFSGHATLLKQLRPCFRPGMIVIDTTVPLAAAVGGSPSRTLGVWQGSAAQEAAELLPKEVALAAAFHHVSAEVLHQQGPVDCDVLICADDEGARSVAGELAEMIPGARAIHAGRLENARTVEQITALLIAINQKYKVHTAGLRLTGLPLAAPRL